MTKNLERARRALHALMHYQHEILGESGPVDDSVITDLLTDIMHSLNCGLIYPDSMALEGEPVPPKWADFLGKILRMASLHFEIESTCERCRTGMKCNDCSA